MLALLALKLLVLANKLLQLLLQLSLEELKQCRQGTLCPHGRPTIITLSLREIEKRFGRR